MNGSRPPPLPPAPPESLRDRVFTLLDEQITPDEALDLDEDDPYVIWMASRALNADAKVVAEIVRQWLLQAAARARVESPGTRQPTG